MESKTLLKRLKAFSSKNKLPDVVFHSLRSTSTSAKLKLNHGDIKAVQGDTGHSQAKMILDVYAKVQDENRRDTAMMIEREIYAPASEQPLPNDAVAIVEILKQQPELIAPLVQALSVLTASNMLTKGNPNLPC